jgi:cytochrome c oxidase assembly protein subunit 11
MTPRRRGSWLPYALAGIGFTMLCMSFAAVPLYRAFCRATGYGGTPQIGGIAENGQNQGKVTVRFNASVADGLPWSFGPDQNQLKVGLGDEQVAFFHAENESSGPVSGIAIYNVTPEKAAHYFHKTACFCFNQQTLDAGQKMEFPVSFYVDPAITTDPDTADVQTITLSYSFFRTLEDARRSGALAHAGPHVGANPRLISALTSRGQP